MNSKRAKRLRRQAEQATVGLPDRGLVRHPRRGYALVDPRTTRGVYLALKRAERA